jgi:hypothetical protein
MPRRAKEFRFMDGQKPPAGKQPSREQFIHDVEDQLKKGRQSLDELKREMQRSKRLLDDQKPRRE